MEKYEFTFLQRLKHFAMASLNLFIVIPILILLLIFATFIKFINCGVIGVIKSGFIEDTAKRIVAIFFVWLCLTANLFKQNRRNIALCLCVLKSLKFVK